MTDTTTNMSSNAHHAIDSAASKTSDTLRPLMDTLVSSAHSAVERLAQVATTAADKVEVSGDYVKSMQQQATNGTRSFVRDRPLTALGIAVASGYLLACALRQR